ncbi:universal stress protein [Halorientalis halophila]|uniref:universal stress protein n=1 Tax=Halorientalis halophila TaxID=3108499 RepID=UPI00300BAC86
MFETVVIATDGSESVERAVAVALDLAARFDATVHALYVIDGSDVEGSPEQVRDDLRDALETAGEEALEAVVEHADRDVATAVREGKPATEICEFVDDVDADVVAMGTRGRHGEHSFLLGSVAEAVVRRCPTPVLTVRQLEADEEPPTGRP